MGRIFAAVALMLAMAACADDDSITPTDAAPQPDATVTTSGADVVDLAYVPSPELISAAVAAGDLDQLEADLYMTLAIFSGGDDIPAEYLVLLEDAADFPVWDHSATSRLVERWDELSQEDQTLLRVLIPGLEEFVGSPIKSFRSVRNTENCFPTDVDVWICLAPSITSNPVPDLPLEEAAAAIHPWVAYAASEAFPRFEALNIGPQPFLIKIYLANLHGNSGFTYGIVPGDQPQGGGGICHAYVDVILAGATSTDPVHQGDPSVPDGVPLPAEIQATVAHEMFHCFQRAAGIPYSKWLYEGTATWSEHHVFPVENTEIRYMKPWVGNPRMALFDRAYDASFGFVYADINGSGSSAVVDVLTANSIASLDSNFGDFWHEISVSAWNQNPVEVLVNTNGALIPAVVADWGIMPINGDAEETMEFSLAPYSRDVQTFEFMGGTSEQELAILARLKLDLSSVPSDVKISVLAETVTGWKDPELLTGSDRVFCRIAVGPCNDADPATIHPYTELVLIVTNTGSSQQDFSLPWDTFNPRLHGSWRRTVGPVSLIPGNASPYSILGTDLSFDEPNLTMAEDVNSNTISYHEDGWECEFGGAYSITGDPSYDVPLSSVPSDGTVSGIVALSGAGTGTTFINDCVYTSEVRSSGLNVPLTGAAGPTREFGFVIQGYDTLVIEGFAVRYVYTRVSHTP